MQQFKSDRALGHRTSMHTLRGDSSALAHSGSQHTQNQRITAVDANGPLARKLKYVRNVGDVTSGGASATILCTEKIGETAVLVVGCSCVPESCSLPRVCKQGVKVLTLRLATAFETCESTVA